MSALSVVLRHPVQALRPNGRVHWAVKARAVRRARQKALVLTLAERSRGEVFRPVRYTVTWFYKGACPDADNCLASCKAYLDGCADALGVDDRTLECSGITRVHDKGRAGTVEIVFYG